MALLHTTGYRPETAQMWPVDASPGSAGHHQGGSVAWYRSALRHLAAATCSAARVIRDTVYVTADVLRGRYDR
jgi:hypothetical protein